MAEGDITIPSLQLALSLTGSYAKQVDIDTAVKTISISKSLSLTNGQGDNQGDLLWYDSRQVSSGVPEDLDLAGSLSDLYGQTLTLVELVMLIIHNKSTTAAEQLQIGGDANAVPIFGATADYLLLGAGGFLVYTAPYDGTITVTAGTGDILQVAAASGTIDYDIVVVGRSA